MTEPICQGLRAGGPYDDWKDVPCGSPATTTFDGRPVCEDHRSRAEDREREAIAEHFFDGVPLEDLRRIAAAGGLKALLAEVERLKAEQRVVAATDERPNLFCPACGSVSIKRCDSEHALCDDCDLLFRESRLILEAP